MVITLTKALDYIILGEKKFIYAAFPAKSSRKGGYFEVLVDGKYKLLKRRKITFIDAKEAAALRDPEPPRFRSSTDTYYFLQDKSDAIKIKTRKKALLKLLAKDKKKLAEYIDNEKISVKNESGLKKLFEYYNSL